MRFNLTVLTLAGCCLLVGCDKPEAEKPAPVNTNATVGSVKVTKTNTPAAPAKDDFPDNADPSVPLKDYMDLNELPIGKAITYLVLAKAPNETTAQQKLEWLLPEYLNTSDAFKRQDIEKQQGPVIQETIKRYADNDYYSVPIRGDGVIKGIGLQNVFVRQYDFATSSFPIQSYGQYCWAFPVTNDAGMNLLIRPSKFPCAVEVKDQEQARAVEEARSQGRLSLGGTLYVYVPKAANGTATGEIIHGVVELTDSQTSKVLARYQQ